MTNKEAPARSLVLGFETMHAAWAHGEGVWQQPAVAFGIKPIWAQSRYSINCNFFA